MELTFDIGLGNEERSYTVTYLSGFYNTNAGQEVVKKPHQWPRVIIYD